MRLSVTFALCVLPAVAATFAPLSAGAQDTTITIRALSSTLEFVPAQISVKAGARVRLRFVNEGTYPHNFVLAKSDDDVDALAAAAMQAGESAFIPPDMRDKLVAYTRLIGPGETGEVTFTVPPAGKYTFVCLFPGHANTMIGTLRALKERE